MTIMQLGEPNLSEVERNRSAGIAVLYYTDGDYRCKWFTPTYFTDNEDEWWEVDAQQVLAEYLPVFKRALEKQRLTPGEPQHAGIEIYWSRMMVWQEVFPDYEPVLLHSEETV
jgi:hypothetical protein